MVKYFIILKNGNIYSPKYIGQKDILIAGGKIVLIEDEIKLPSILNYDIYDLQGNNVIPGFIDSHIHIAGAGGEGGPATRTPELSFEDIISGGITSLVGCLGTDGITRSVESVLMKAKGLKQQGLSAWIYTGAYQVPPPTILGSVSKDIALIEEILGVGEIAIADHRSSYPTIEEFIKLIQAAKVGGLLGKKSGIINIHLGDNGDPFELIYQAVKNNGIQYNQFLPTHCNRSRNVFEASKKYGKNGYIDLTTSSYPYFKDIEIKPSEALIELLNSGIPETHITMSSDSGGSLPEFNNKGEFIASQIGKPVSLFNEIRDLIKADEQLMEFALKTVTSNVADILKLENKGRIVVGYDADIIVLDQNKTEILNVFLKGNLIK